jgi:hypothetical protein
MILVEGSYTRSPPLKIAARIGRFGFQSDRHEQHVIVTFRMVLETFPCPKDLRASNNGDGMERF